MVPGRVQELEAWYTLVYVAVGGRLAGAVALQDLPRPGAVDAVTRLHGLGVRTTLLPGDSVPVAEAVAREVGIAKVYAGLLPEGESARD
jgi:Cu+-exporting ATPase